MASSRRKSKLKLNAIFLLMVVIQVTMIYNTINYNYFRFKLKQYNIDIFYKKYFRLKLHFGENQSLIHGNATVAKPLYPLVSLRESFHVKTFHWNEINVLIQYQL